MMLAMNDNQPIYQAAPQQSFTSATSSQGNGLAVASLVLAIIGIVVGIIPLFIGLVLSFVPCILGIVFGFIGISRANNLPDRRGFGMALAGLIIAGVNFLLYFTGYGIIW